MRTLSKRDTMSRGKSASQDKYQIEYVPLSDIAMYDKNPRINEPAIDKVAKSIRDYGFLVPIVVDKDGIILAGHTRYKASQKLGLKEVPIIRANSLSEIKGREFRLVDNRTSEFAQWDSDLLKEELDAIANDDLSEFFEFDELTQSLLDDEAPTSITDDDTYTQKVELPIYTPNTSTEVDESMLVNTEYFDKLMKEIDDAKISEKAKDFLRLSAYRHLRFDYTAIADYYAKADKTVQDLMERSGLVIIDYNKALEYGFVEFSNSLKEIMGQNDDEE